VLASVLALVFAVCLATPIIEELTEEQEYNMLTDFAHFIGHYGHEAIDFLLCMGPSFVTHCAKPVLECLVSRTIKGCITAISCEGHDAVVCAHHLRNDTTH